MGSKALFLNCWRYKSNSIFRDYKRILLKELNGVTRVTYHGRNVLVGTRNKFRLTSKKNSSLLATVIRPNKQKTLTHQSVITELDEDKINESSKLQNEYRNNKLSTIVRKEDIATIPNLLCVMRIALSPVLGYLVLQHNYSCALGIFVFAGVTDLLDGMIARQFPSQRSMLGSFLDPMADKLLVSTLFLSLTAADLIPVPLTALIISRDVCLMCAGFYIRYVSLPFPKTLSRYFDMTLATANLSPTVMSKVNTSVQLSLVATTLAASVAGMTDHPGLHGLWYVTAATTIASAMSYVFVKDTFKLFRHPHLNRKRLSARRFLPTRNAAGTRHTIAQQEI